PPTAREPRSRGSRVPDELGPSTLDRSGPFRERNPVHSTLGCSNSDRGSVSRMRGASRQRSPGLVRWRQRSEQCYGQAAHVRGGAAMPRKSDRRRSPLPARYHGSSPWSSGRRATPQFQKSPHSERSRFRTKRKSGVEAFFVDMYASIPNQDVTDTSHGSNS